MLLDAKADVNAQSGQYGTPILGAFHSGHFHQMQVLLDAGSDAFISDELGRTPLHIAASRDMLHILNRSPLFPSAVNIRGTLS